MMCIYIDMQMGCSSEFYESGHLSSNLLNNICFLLSTSFPNNPFYVWNRIMESGFDFCEGSSRDLRPNCSDFAVLFIFSQNNFTKFFFWEL